MENINKYTLVGDIAEEFGVTEKLVKNILKSLYKRRMHHLLKGDGLWTVGGKISITEKTRRKVFVPTLNKVMKVSGKKISFSPSRHLYAKLNENGEPPQEI